MVKRLFDILLSGAGLLVSAPLWPIIAAAITLDDGGPVFFVQPRVGKGGCLFHAYKFRSMIPGAARSLPFQALADDPRVTRIGGLLRATAMDELPQLFNILRGDMSFVGPRPLMPNEIEGRGDGGLRPLCGGPGYAARAALRPG